MGKSHETGEHDSGSDLGWLLPYPYQTGEHDSGSESGLPLEPYPYPMHSPEADTQVHGQADAGTLPSEETDPDSGS
jgi:hypothetical protein